MIMFTEQNRKGENQPFAWKTGDPHPTETLGRGAKVLEADISGDEMRLLFTHFTGLPRITADSMMKTKRNYVRFSGDFAQFIWDNLPTPPRMEDDDA